MQDPEQAKAKKFDDPRNIQVGKAKVIWADRWYHRPEGWRLPGGGITNDFTTAHEMAGRMNHLMGGEPPKLEGDLTRTVRMVVEQFQTRGV